MMPEAGHITPTLRIANFLRDRGHEISYVTVSHYGGLFERLGFASEVMDDVPAVAQDDADFWSARQSGAMIARALRLASLERGSTWAMVMLDAVMRTQPDLLLCDTTIVHSVERALLEQIGRPVVALGVCLPTKVMTHLPEMVLCPVEFDLPADERPPNRSYCEPSIWRDRTAVRQLPAWHETHEVTQTRPLVYCSLGTQSVNYPQAIEVLRTVCTAFEALPSHQLVLAAGTLYDELAGTPLSDNIQLVRSASQLEVLQRAAVVITHGGLGTLKEAVLARVPCVVVPFTFDQPVNARRVVHHGLGRVCPPSDCSPETIRHHVLDLIDDPRVHEKLDDLSRVFWRSETEAPAGRAVHEMLGGGADALG